MLVPHHTNFNRIMMDFNKRENKSKEKCIDFSVAKDKRGMTVDKHVWEAKIMSIAADRQPSYS